MSPHALHTAIKNSLFYKAFQKYRLESLRKSSVH
jgi:hypothetical protein